MNHEEYKDPIEQYKDDDLFRPLFPEPDVGHQLKCPNCKELVMADNINIDKAIAKCTNCSSVFSFDHSSRYPYRNRPEVFQPEGIEMLRLRNELDIDFKWRNAKSVSVPFIFFAVLWNVMLLPFVGVAIMSGQLAFLLGVSVHLFVGLGFLYHILTVLINTTYISIDEYDLIVEHRPLKHIANRDKNIECRDIDQIYVKKYVTGRTNDVIHHAHKVVVILNNGDELDLIAGIRNKEKALYLEQEIELFLKIKDRPVEGEVK